MTDFAQRPADADRCVDAPTLPAGAAETHAAHAHHGRGGGTTADIIRAVGNYADADTLMPMDRVVASVEAMTPGGRQTPYPRTARPPAPPPRTSLGVGGNGLQVTVPALGAAFSAGPAAAPPAVSEPLGQVRNAARDSAAVEPVTNAPPAPTSPVTPLITPHLDTARIRNAIAPPSPPPLADQWVPTTPPPGPHPDDVLFEVNVTTGEHRQTILGAPPR